MNEITEAFTIIRDNLPAHVKELASVLESRLTVAETLVRLHEQHSRLLASGDAPTLVSPPTPEKAVSLTACAEANNVIPIGHSVKVPEQHAWRIDGGAA